ncbi:MAG: type II secretion system F family protein [Actinobacteria bacterium]|nr:type II secretion system F family protein [Actinomycetota bacterium]
MTGRLSRYGYGAGKEGKEVSSFSDRVIMPVLRRIASVVGKASPKGIVKSTEHKLELAGLLERGGANVYLAVKFLFAVVFLFIFILLLILYDFRLIVSVLLLVLIPISYFLPDIYLRNKIKNRQEKIRSSLPNALDMLTIIVEAGLSFDVALSRIVSSIEGPMGEEFNKMLKEMNIGLSRREALRNLVKRTNVQDLDSFITAMVQAEILGVPIGKILRTQASEMRIRRSNRAEEEGIKAPVKLVFPLILCLLPALMAVIIGPGLITIYESLIKILN